MTKKTIARLVLASTAAALTAACAASTEPQSTAHEDTQHTEQALSSCTDFQNANSTETFVPACSSLLKTQSSNDASYSDGACPYFGAEWDGTDTNPSGYLSLNVAATVAEADCGAFTLSYLVYGLVESTNPAIYGNPYWAQLPIGQTVTGTWDGSVCRFPTVTFSDQVPGASGGTLRRYVDTKVFAQGYTTTTVKGRTSRGYYPVYITLQPQAC